jgi:hypothetical protein
MVAPGATFELTVCRFLGDKEGWVEKEAPEGKAATQRKEEPYHARARYID